MTTYTSSQIGEAKKILELQGIELLNQMENLDYRLKRIDWVYFALGYLKVVRVSCQFLLENEPKIYEYSIFAILYNFKHSLELIVKAIIFTVEKETEQNHNIKELFDSFNLKFKRQNSRKKVDVQDLLDNLSVLVSKYYSLDFLSDKIGKARPKIIDKKNTFTRYPDGVTVQIEYGMLAKLITKPEIKMIIEDTTTAETIFVNLFTLLKENS